MSVITEASRLSDALAAERGGYAYATGYLDSFIGMLPYNLKLSKKQTAALKELLRRDADLAIERNLAEVRYELACLKGRI